MRTVEGWKRTGTVDEEGRLPWHEERRGTAAKQAVRGCKERWWGGSRRHGEPAAAAVSRVTGPVIKGLRTRQLKKWV